VSALTDLVDDLRAEQEALDAVVGGLDAERWATPTPSPGWSVADQIGHLTYFDGTAVLAMEDPEAFTATIEALLAGGAAMDDVTLHRHLDPAALLAQWRANRAGLLASAAGLADDVRVPWYGPPMSAKSFVTARLMETWAHGQDVVDAVAGDRPATDRLRHVAQLGVITRKWSYVNRGLRAPAAEIRVELTGPSGEAWTWGPEDTADRVQGGAEDFCLVVTQRRHLADTGLVAAGDAARDWMTVAQAFAGPPTAGPQPRG
jgi:uncharacterized protein (TIGR03084 family)